MNKIAILCMGKKGLQAINDIVKTFGSEIINFVVGARDLQIQNDFYDEILSLTTKYNIKFYDRNSDWEICIHDEYVFVIAWRWLVNQKNNKKLIIVHDSLLPKYRGFCPLVNMLINMEPELGVTFLYASATYDAGDIILQKKITINYPIKLVDAIDLVATKYSEGLIEIIQKIQLSDKIPYYTQNKDEATFSLWRDEDDYLINFNESAENVKRFIDAVGFPYKGAVAYIKSEKVRIMDAEIFTDKKIENRNIHIGKVVILDCQFPIIICKEGLLKILSVINDKNGKSMLPLVSFRTRFKGQL
ncbi:MAG: methionyl-tRNA formyltransferase [Gammaproteobacteria bacterium]|nr:methionyl-tRNA formyltransferase [Gammaproteobacteria bacterium]